MTIKLITTEDYGWDEAPVSLFRTWSRGIESPAGVKVASALTEEMKDLKPERDETLVHTLAVGSTERYGPNRNGDGFSRGENKKAHVRFVKNGHVFKHHCFPAGALVTMSDGTVRGIEEISIGDAVLDHLGGSSEVLKVYRRGFSGGFVSLTLAGSPKGLTATDEHPVLVYRRAQIHCRHKYNRIAASTQLSHWARCKEFREDIGEPSWVPMCEVSIGDYLVSPPVSVGSVHDPDMARVAGWLASEGCIGKDSIQFTFSKKSTGCVQSCLSAFSAIGVELAVYDANDPSCVLLVKGSRALCRELGKYVVGKSVSKRLTGVWKTWDAESRLRFLGAYIDGDGCVSKRGRNSGYLRIRSISSHLRSQLSLIIQSLGVPCGVGLDIDGGVKEVLGRACNCSESGCVFVPKFYAPVVCAHAEKRVFCKVASRCGRSYLLHGATLRKVTSVERSNREEKVYNLETAPSHSYVVNGVAVHNCNKDPAKACGSIKLSAYNDAMDRIELVIALKNGKCADEIQKLASGKDLPGSMGCRVSHDICSICNHKAPSPKDYCDHAKLAMTRILDDGRQVYVDNPDPHYFDWSLVGRPADRIAYGYGIKTASFDDPFLFSTELAKMAGLYLPDDIATQERIATKLAVLGKLSEMEKEIEAKLTPMDDALGSCTPGGALGKGDAKKLKAVGMPNVMEALHRAQVILPVDDFLKLISADRDEDLSEYADEVSGELPGIFGDMADNPEQMLDDFGFDGGGEAIPSTISPLINGLINSFGMGAQPLGRRVTVTIIRGKPISKRVTKTASDDTAVKGLARLYGQYKLGALTHPANVSDDALLRASVVQHYYRNN